ncbi:MAG TPA: uracil-DNA glycosylase, partial [Flavobacterium sp.]|nr:uracil-DNA glycosylase [Flavobacterium sp.]
GLSSPNNGNLERWAKQGVLLLNSILTVQKNSPGSHQNKGWEIFTNKIIQSISENKKQVVFMLWGSYAQQKGLIIDANKHKILQAP